MILHILFILLAIATNSTITFLTGLYDKWWFILIMVIILPIMYYVWFFIYMGYLILLSKFLKKDYLASKPNKFFLGMLRRGEELSLHICRIKVVKTGFENIPEGKVMFVANHRSNFDPIIFCAIVPKKNLNAVCVTKPEALDMFLFGRYLRHAGYIPIDREDAFKAAKTIAQASKYIKDDLASIVIFPEGTRNPNTNETLEFHGGSYKIATRTNTPTVVVSLTNTDDIRKRWPFKRTTVYIDVVKVFNSDDYKEKNTVDLATESEELINKKYKERKGL